jgi:hypothetical protein
MYITRVPNRGSPPAVLLRESYRENGKVKTRTLANLSRWPEHKVNRLDRALSLNTVQLRLHACSLGVCLERVGLSRSRIVGCRIWCRWAC